jgi:hypothetical protein
MKKTLLGLAAMGCLVFAGQQATANTLPGAINNLSAPLYFTVNTGYSQSVYGNSSGLATDINGAFQVNEVDNVTSGATLFSAGTSFDHLYAVFSGAVDTSNNPLTGDSYSHGGTITFYELFNAAPTTNFALGAGTGAEGAIVTAYNNGLGGIKLFTATFDSLFQHLNLNTSGVADGTGNGYALISIIEDDAIGHQLDSNMFNGSDISINLTLNNLGAFALGVNNWSSATAAGFHNSGDASANSVPEPTTMLLFGTGLIGLAGIGRRKLRK